MNSQRRSNALSPGCRAARSSSHDRRHRRTLPRTDRFGDHSPFRPGRYRRVRSASHPRLDRSTGNPRCAGSAYTPYRSGKRCRLSPFGTQRDTGRHARNGSAQGSLGHAHRSPRRHRFGSSRRRRHGNLPRRHSRETALGTLRCGRHALGAVVVVLTVGRIGRRHLSRPGVLIDDATACARILRRFTTGVVTLPRPARQVQAPVSPLTRNQPTPWLKPEIDGSKLLAAILPGLW